MSQRKNRWRPTRRHVFWGSLTLFLSLLFGPLALTGILRNQTIRKTLAARLERSFGRPVEVGNFSVSLLGGARIEANFVTVAEDPRFGQEFFLRAERVTAGIRWRSLLAGRLEFGTLSMLRPSLNVVRNAEGLWNVMAWLPPSGARLPAPSAAALAPRLFRINIDTGRINFKQGADKHPFALLDVHGSLSQGPGGGWQVDFETQPFRAGTMAQTPGVIRVRGAIGGPDSRILPADLTATWNEVALADVMRLLRGSDFGIRGELGAIVRIQAAAAPPADPQWSFAGSARVQALHGAALPPRGTDPALNLRVEAEWQPARARILVKDALLEAAHSSLRASGQLDWSPRSTSQTALRLVSPGTSLADLLAIYRAFRPGVAGAIGAEGSLGFEAEWHGWPPALHRLLLSSGGARVAIPGLENPVGFGPSSLRYDARSQRLTLSPVGINFSSGAALSRGPAVSVDALRFDGFARWQSALPAEFRLEGAVRSAGSLQVAGAALGLSSVIAWTGAGWDVEGPAQLQLKWRGTLVPFALTTAGSLEARNPTLRSPLFPATVAAGALRIDFAQPLQVEVKDARAFGGAWSGTLTATSLRMWEVSLATPKLNPGEFARSMNLAEFAAFDPARQSPARLAGRVAISPQVPSPLLQPLRPADLLLSVTLQLPLRPARHITGSLAQARQASPDSGKP